MGSIGNRSFESRNFSLILAGWVVTLGAAISAWASHSQSIGVAGRLLGSNLAKILLAFHAFAVLALLALPFLLAGIVVFPGVRSRLFYPPSYPGRRRALLVLLTVIGLLQPLYFVDIGRLLSTIGFLVVAAFVLTIVFLFLRPRMPTRVSILTITWLTLTILTRLTLQALIAAAGQPPGLDMTTVWRIIFIFQLICLVAAPFLVSMRRPRARLWMVLTWLEAAPFALLATVMLIAAAGGVAIRSAPEISTGAWALQRLLAEVGVVAACIALLRLESLRKESLSHWTQGTRTSLLLGALALIAVVYIVQAIRIALNGLYYLNPDGVAYLIIARDFARGIAAIRGYWSPLMPLLLAPAIRIGVDPQVAQRVLIGLTGMAWVGLCLPLGRRLGLNRWMLIALAAAMAIVTLEVAFFPITPDMLGAVILACYFLLVTSEAFPKHAIRSGLTVGLLGALAFYAKFYNLPFLIVHLLLTGTLLVAWGSSIRKIALTVAVALFTVAILVVPWVAALRSRYGGITLTTSGPINHAVFGPSMTWHPCWDQRLCNPPMDVLIPWEDPQIADYADVGWNPLASWDNLRHQVFVTQGNVQAFITDVAFELGPLPVFGTLVLLLGLIAFGLERRTHFLFAWSLMTILLYLSGYMTFIIATRYIIPVIPLAIVGGLRGLQMGFEHVPVSGSASLSGLGRLSMIAAIILSSVNPVTAGFTYLPPDNHCVARTVGEFADKLVAPIAGSDHWVNIIAYYAEKRTVGVLPPTTMASDADSQFRQFGVRTYVVGQEDKLGADLLARGDYTVVAETDLCGNNYLVLRTPIP